MSLFSLQTCVIYLGILVVVSRFQARLRGQPEASEKGGTYMRKRFGAVN